jgi:hypothetical protein
MTDLERVALKPCPFCWGKSELDRKDGVTGNQWFPSCLDDDCIGFVNEPFTTFATQREAVAAWNTRATPAGAWRPIETAPKDGTEVITARRKPTGWEISTDCYTIHSLHDRGWLIGTEFWLPLPAPPAAEDDDAPFPAL